MPLELHETEPLAQNRSEASLSSIRVELEMESQQRNAATGLTLAVVVVNTGAETVDLQRPDDAVQVELLDASGSPVIVPTRPPDALVNQRRKPGPRPNAPSILNLAPGRSHRVLMTIREVKHGADPAEIRPLSAGDYRLRVRVLLLAADPNLDREFSYRVLVSDWVPIQLG